MILDNAHRPKYILSPLPPSDPHPLKSSFPLISTHPHLSHSILHLLISFQRYHSYPFCSVPFHSISIPIIIPIRYLAPVPPHSIESHTLPTRSILSLTTILVHTQLIPSHSQLTLSYPIPSYPTLPHHPVLSRLASSYCAFFPTTILSNLISPSHFFPTILLLFFSSLPPNPSDPLSFHPILFHLILFHSCSFPLSPRILLDNSCTLRATNT